MYVCMYLRTRYLLMQYNSNQYIDRKSGSQVNYTIRIAKQKCLYVCVYEYNEFWKICITVNRKIKCETLMIIDVLCRFVRYIYIHLYVTVYVCR